MTEPATTPDTARLKRRFVGWMVVNGVLAATAAGLGVVHITLHPAWAMPAMFVVIALALAAQIVFLSIVRKDTR
jgi:hypothetical protein